MTRAVLAYDQARSALEKAKTLDEVKTIVDKAEAMRQYARRAEDRELEIWAAELRVLAMDKYGELRSKVPKAPGPGRGKKRRDSAGASFSGKRGADKAARASTRFGERCEQIHRVGKKTLNAELAMRALRKARAPVPRINQAAYACVLFQRATAALVTRGQVAGEIATANDTLKRGSRPPETGERKNLSDLGIKDQRLAEWRLLGRYSLEDLRAARDAATKSDDILNRAHLIQQAKRTLHRDVQRAKRPDLHAR